MPEGPEVKCCAESLNAAYAGMTLLSITAGDNPRPIDGSETFTAGIILKGVTSYGKKVIFDFGEKSLVCGLGMTGEFIHKLPKHRAIVPQKDDPEEKDSPDAEADAQVLRYPYTANHVRYTFNFGVRKVRSGRVVVYTKGVLLYNDKMKMGRMKVVETECLAKHLKKTVGPDMLSGPPSLDAYTAKVKKIKSSILIGKFLLEQKYFSGVGNYLKSEILFDAGVSPYRDLGSLSDEDIKTLYESTIKVLQESYNLGGKGYIKPDGVYGAYMTKCYNRDHTDDHEQIHKEKVTSKSRYVYWCPSLQR